MIDKKVYIGVGVILIFTYFFIYNEAFYAFIISLLLLFKTKAISLFSASYLALSTFLSASKVKLISYIKTLTLYKTIALGVKRFIIDNVFSQWLNEVVIAPLMEASKQYVKYYLSLDLKSKFKKFLYFALPMGIFVYIIQAAGLIEHIVFFAELKTIVIGFFKILWLVSGKIISTVIVFFQTSWLAPIVEIFALSWLISKLEKIPYIGKYISAFFQWISNMFDFIFKAWNFIYNNYIYNKLSKQLKEKVTNFSNKMINSLENTKHNNEIYVIREFKKDFIETGELRRVIEKFGMREADIITSKAIKIKAYLEVDTGYVLLIESFASCNENGNSHTKITGSHFWILNYSKEDIEVISRNNYFTRKIIKPNKMILINALIQSINDIEIIQNSIQSKLISLEE